MTLRKCYLWSLVAAVQEKVSSEFKTRGEGKWETTSHYTPQELMSVYSYYYKTFIFYWLHVCKLTFLFLFSLIREINIS